MDKEVHSDDEIYIEIKDFVIEGDRVQAGDPPLYVLTSDIWWSKGASSSEGTEPSTSGAPFVDPNWRYIHEDWVSRLSNKKLGFISHELC